MGAHDYTCAHDEGLPIPTIKDKTTLIVQFFEYAKMYCKNCGHVYSKSQEQIDVARAEEPSRLDSAE